MKKDMNKNMCIYEQITIVLCVNSNKHQFSCSLLAFRFILAIPLIYIPSARFLIVYTKQPKQLLNLTKQRNNIININKSATRISLIFISTCCFFDKQTQHALFVCINHTPIADILMNMIQSQ